MTWMHDVEDDLGLLSNEIEDLEDDEVSLREAAFIDGYNNALERPVKATDSFEEAEEEDGSWED